MIEFNPVFTFVPRQYMVEGGLVLSTLLPACECFRRESCPMASLLIDPVEQSTDVLPSGETRESCFQRSQRGVSSGDFMIPSGLFIEESVTGLLGFGFGLSRSEQFQLSQSRLLSGEPSESEERGVELVHGGGWFMVYGLRFMADR